MSSPGPSQVIRTPTVFLQNACYMHQFIRSKDTSAIVERPERLRAVSIGLSAAISRIEEAFSSLGATGQLAGTTEDALVAALDKMKLSTNGASISKDVVPIVQSMEKVNLLDSEAVKYVHGDIEGDVYLENLRKWAEQSAEKIVKGESEIPQGLSQGDLYRKSVAIEGAIGTVIEAVDYVVSSPAGSSSHITQHSRAFVAIRPPGHHCGEDTPSGFCFVNNVAIGAAHAHLKHGINRVVIFDIDLHHGNGTQSIAWQINEETYRQKLEEEEGAAPSSKPGLQVYYSSVHDILSYPCEDGKPELVQAASVSIHKSHGQYIENVHLQPYQSEEHFWNTLYKDSYSKILKKAEEFLDETGGPGDDVLFFISCGLDACEHEYESMSRHGRKVPTSYYYRFARDACALSDKYAHGRLISVLEGGYSDRALISGGLAHLVGLTDFPTSDSSASSTTVDERWWSVENLEKIEKATKNSKRRGGRPSLQPPLVPPIPTSPDPDQWITRTLEIFNSIDADGAFKQATSNVTSVNSGPSTRSATKGKARTSLGKEKPTSRAAPLKAAANSKAGKREKNVKGEGKASSTSSPASSLTSLDEDEGGQGSAEKKLPRVILKLGPGPGSD
ncbi:Arginase/deacetylase [Pluteus cervinus]|uniref:Arginase/deacetylase n=1 Tax=Pluteus cervinus TaxID=181527 RepID=A0ACD3AI06_9AGAR|nr:Arginase/deacetylase [Pluteus cervinus]